MKKILLLVFALVLCGCATHKSAVKETIRRTVTESVDSAVKESQTTMKSDNTAKDIKVNTTDKTVTVATETEYSKPDESGNQYKMVTRVIETRNDVAMQNEQSERTISEQKKEIDRLTKDKSELQSKLDNSLSEKTTTTTRAPFWTYLVAFAIGAVGALLIRSWLKRKFNL